MKISMAFFFLWGIDDFFGLYCSFIILIDEQIRKEKFIYVWIVKRMFEIYRVAFFGHREVDDMRRLESRLIPILKRIMDEHTYIEFYIGRNGEFDEIVASVIKRLKKEREMSYNIMILVLPYTVKDIEYYENYYDEIMIPESIEKAHYKNAITLRNKWMVDVSDLVIVNVERHSGGAYTAMHYAEKQNKRIINLYELEEE